ncbi:hypothetical protein UA08_04785 [Talaromyces atroroseus]|uniref:BZIP domain-containing protein n=1 Tax=Talaromyces atroroseus TaxID=1441469 RepID=A0A225B2C4_TALAT|nr:hypothetical protein UA08_04785 [Talaromyces atroroseus]OKL59997.1 hypothetical protein UA08_04785 [Talaromyces atroroseus]
MHHIPPMLDFDTTRIASRVERRRQQNRLNQRARRFRKKVQNAKPESAEASNELRSSPYGILVPSSSRCTTIQVTTNFDQPAAVLPNLHIPNYIVLTQLNVWQATLINSLILGISHFFTDEDDADNNNDSLTEIEDLSYLPHYLSPPSPKDSLSSSSLRSPTKTIPPSLRPTTLQQTIPHYPWIDLIPLAGLRDSLIRAGPRLEVHDFCMDIMGDMFHTQPLDHSGSAASQGGLLVWGDSWLIESWEMTEVFVQKWGWLLDEGCEEIVKATNRWREGRGEDELVVRS